MDDTASILIVMVFVIMSGYGLFIMFRTKRRSIVAISAMLAMYLYSELDDYFTPVEKGNLDILEIGSMTCVKLYDSSWVGSGSNPGYGCYPTDFGKTK